MPKLPPHRRSAGPARRCTTETAEVIHLDAAESRKLVENLLRPAREPNASMRAAQQHYRNAVRSK
jgi:hypothetical protein